jgi:DNA-directed RNA polymerase subunit RPC12/RpoP
MIEETRCSLCRSYLDREDLFCSNCGTENKSGVDSFGQGVESQAAPLQQASALSFRCNQCGASMSYDASAKSLRCPFCGSTKMTARPDARTLKPAGVVPFQVEHSQVESLLRQWLSQGFWKPGDAAQRSIINKVTQVFVPFWVFEATTETAWAADSSSVRFGARASWRPMSGTLNNRYEGLLVGASGTLTPIEIQEIAPFDLTQAVSPNEVDLDNVIVEEFRVPRRDARIKAASLVEQLEASRSQETIPGSTRNLGVNVRIQDMRSFPLLLPIWIMVYQYNGKPFRVLVNGQTREVYGTAPFSYAKLTGVIAIMFLVVLAVIVIAVIAASMR